MSSIWSAFSLGKISLPHRLALAPMTRLRALPDGTPSDLAVQYYAQRASFGLLISEGTEPSAQGKGYLGSPGLYTQSHILGWKKVADAVHAHDGYLFIQLMHAGRVSHADVIPTGETPVGPSAIPTPQTIMTSAGPQAAPVPRALLTEEIPLVQEQFVTAAANAMIAGADGVELHGANGYLLWQFLTGNANQRTDQYGGSIENRARFVLETVSKVVAKVGAERVGIRLSPNMNFLGMHEDADWKETYRYLLNALAPLGLAYVHFFYFGDDEFLAEIRQILKNTPILLVRAGRTLDSISKDLEQGVADVFPVATMAISNPDLVTRLKHGYPLTEPKQEFFYGGGETGYVDYETVTSN